MGLQVNAMAAYPTLQNRKNGVRLHSRTGRKPRAAATRPLKHEQTKRQTAPRTCLKFSHGSSQDLKNHAVFNNSGRHGKTFFRFFWGWNALLAVDPLLPALRNSLRLRRYWCHRLREKPIHLRLRLARDQPSPRLRLAARVPHSPTPPSKIRSPHLGAREISPRFGLAALFFAETKILAHLVGIRSQPQCFGKICAGLRVAAMITEKHTKLERNFWTIGQQASSCL